MTAEAVLRRVVKALEQSGIPFMLTGSFAGAYHGVPRATQDIDLVVDPTKEQLTSLVRALPASEYYVDEAAALEALRQRGQFAHVLPCSSVTTTVASTSISAIGTCWA